MYPSEPRFDADYFQCRRWNYNVFQIVAKLGLINIVLYLRSSIGCTVVSATRQFDVTLVIGVRFERSKKKKKKLSQCNFFTYIHRTRD